MTDSWTSGIETFSGCSLIGHSKGTVDVDRLPEDDGGLMLVARRAYPARAVTVRLPREEAMRLAAHIYRVYGEVP